MDNILQKLFSKMNYISFDLYLYLWLSKNKMYTKELSQIKELYSEFIKNYNKMNKDFGFDNPIEIHTMYNYLLYNGYLSKDKKFESSDKEVKDIALMNGFNVLMGRGVCRHKSSMLTDILKDYGMLAYNLTCDSYERKIKISQNKCSYQEVKNWILKYSPFLDEDYFKELNSIIDSVSELKTIPELQWENYRKNCWFFQNHQITLANDGSYNYFLDPTREYTEISIYRPESGSKILYEDPIYMLKYSLHKNAPTNDSVDNQKMFIMLKKDYPFIPICEEQEMVSKVKKIYNENTFIFEQFYIDNKEIYDEISSISSKIKIKGIIS